MSRLAIKVFSVILVAALVGTWAFTEITVHQREAKWLDFRKQWEAKGENFGAQSTPRFPDEKNYVEHPFIRKLRADDPDAKERLFQMAPQWLDVYQDWLESLPPSNGGREPPMPESVARAVLSFYDGFSAEITELSEAADRPVCMLPLSKDSSALHNWQKNVTRYGNALSIRARAAQVVGDEALSDACIDSLLKTARLLEASGDLLTTLSGGVMESSAHELILARKGAMSPAKRKEWTALLDGISADHALAITRCMRSMRFEYLEAMDHTEKVSTAGWHRIWFPGRIRVELLKERLMICEALQNEILAPHGYVLHEVDLKALRKLAESLPPIYDTSASPRELHLNGYLYGLHEFFQRIDERGKIRAELVN